MARSQSRKNEIHARPVCIEVHDDVDRTLIHQPTTILKKGPMNKKPPISRILKPKPRTRSALPSWHNGADPEIHLYARSLQNAAKTLVGKLEPQLDHETGQSPRTDWDACPIVLLYREAIELHLKALVGEGSNFLKTRTDPISLSQTHSLRWLAQIVCQIIRRVGWESDFTCEGVSSLADFSALVNEVESFDPVTRAIRSAGAKDPNPARISIGYSTSCSSQKSCTAF